MAELPPLRGMSADERQLIKEAVCDAVLSRTHNVISGRGEFGAVILGSRPSRALTSGFILPRINDDGDDEASDIHICSHGMDLRVLPAVGSLDVSVEVAVYVRALPSAEELFGRNGRLIPPADFNDQTRKHIRDMLKARSSDEIPAKTPTKERAERRARIAREIYKSLGVGIPDNAIVAGQEVAEGESEAEATQRPAASKGRLRIPDNHSRRYSIPEKWVRLAVESPKLALPLPCDPDSWEVIATEHKRGLNAAIDSAFRRWITSDMGAAWAWRRITPPSEAFWSADAWNDFLRTCRNATPNPQHLVPTFDAQILVQPLRDPRADHEYSVRVAIENLRESSSDLECGLFGVGLSVSAPRQAIGPMQLERVRRSYHLAGFMTMPGIGVNAGIEEIASSDASVLLRTNWMPRYVLPRQKANAIPGLDASFGALSNPTFEPDHLSALPKAMEAWIEHVRHHTALNHPGEQQSAVDDATQEARFAEDLQAWEREARRVHSGVNLLKAAKRHADAGDTGIASAPFRAWLLLNETFSLANPSVAGEDPSAWRLFQLGFILAHLPTLASRLPGYESAFEAEFDEDSVSLLYMATGGGKTEAFFGTVVFALFLDRLRGKERGITAMMHYPLRLLTVQQAQRLARLLARAEIVRRRAVVGGSPFEIGFWVGGTNTPNATEKRAGVVIEELEAIPNWNDPIAADEAALLADKAYAARKEALSKLPTCPFCGSDDGVGLRLYPERHNRLAIVCLNKACSWNKLHTSLEPLPFLLADTDIYRRAPSILLGTIDKLALIGQSPTTIDRIAGMFGLARFVEGGRDGLLHMFVSAEGQPHGTPLAPAHSGGERLLYDPFPSLIIQDEMHLLEESLGTFGGIFETGLMTWLEELAGLLGDQICRVPGAPDVARLPHVIGATATAADVAKHARALYQRRVVQFPHPGPKLHGGFYSSMATFFGEDGSGDRCIEAQSPRAAEQAAPWGRVYASLMTNGRLHTVTTLAVLAAQAATITRWQRDLSSADQARRERAAGEIEASVSDQPYASARRRAVRRALESHRFDRLAALVDLHRIQLIYVTNKKGGDQILSALLSETQEAHASMGNAYGLAHFEMELISGGVDIAGIQRVIRSASRPFDAMSDNIDDALRAIVATSAISHGVDVEYFNAMAFAGMPADIAEYIQASSRVGRTHVGYSLLIPTPQTRRDRFILEVHESFHRLLERMISPPAIERWADRALERAVPSLVQTWVAGVRHQQRFVSASDSEKAQVVLPITVEAMDRLLRNNADFDACVEFVKRAVGVPANVGGPSNPEYYTALVRGAIQRIRATLAGGDFTGLLRDFWSNRLTNLQRPMMSLRDVDAAGRIQASRRTARNQPLDSEDMEEAMAVIRGHSGGRRRRTAGSELDGDT